MNKKKPLSTTRFSLPMNVPFIVLFFWFSKVQRGKCKTCPEPWDFMIQFDYISYFSDGLVQPPDLNHMFLGEKTNIETIWSNEVVLALAQESPFVGVKTIAKWWWFTGVFICIPSLRLAARTWKGICWNTTVDGRHPAPPGMGKILWNHGIIMILRWCRILSINSSFLLGWHFYRCELLVSGMGCVYMYPKKISKCKEISRLHGFWSAFIFSGVVSLPTANHVGMKIVSWCETPDFRTHMETSSLFCFLFWELISI